jgi:thiol-disulfide isomerase/thioredoxin
MRGAFLVLSIALLAACGARPEKAPSRYERLVFVLNDSIQACFPLSVSDSLWEVCNGGEAIQLNQTAEDTYHVPVFNGTLTLASTASGYWTDSLRPETETGAYRVPFTLTEATATTVSQPIAGCWDVWFGDGSKEQAGTADAQLDLRSNDGQIEGTMRTPTGDYRYLAGQFDGSELTLQTFDGAHLFYFGAALTDNLWTDGHFYSGNHYHTTWSAAPAQPWASSVELAKLNPPSDSLFVRLIDADGTPYERSLLPAKGRVTVLDVLGTWCPNCMDEVRLLSSLSMDHADQLSVAFERPDSAGETYKRLGVFRSEMDMDWDVVLGGKANKQVAADAFPFLNRIVSFPTTLFIQDDGTVHVHSGFNGPATGAAYEEEVAAFKRYSAPAISLENR